MMHYLMIYEFIFIQLKSLRLFGRILRMFVFGMRNVRMLFCFGLCSLSVRLSENYIYSYLHQRQ